MSASRPVVETRGGLLVALTVAGVVGFEVRTALGLYLGVDLPAVPYFVGLVGLLVVGAVLADLSRATPESDG